MPRRLRLLLLFAGLGLGTGGCVLRAYFLARADKAAVWYLGRHVTLTKEQESQLAVLVEKHWGIWRCQRLRRVDRELKDFLADYQKAGLNEDLALRLEKRLGSLREEAVKQIAEDAAILLSSLQAEQWLELAATLGERRKRWRELANATPKDFATDYQDELEEQFERWYGPLEKQQRGPLGAAVGLEQAAVIALHEQLVSMHSELITQLGRPRPPAEIAAILTLWARLPEALCPEALRDNCRRARLARFRKLAAVDRLVNPRQRKHLQREITSLIKDLNAVYAKGAGCPTALETPAASQGPAKL